MDKKVKTFLNSENDGLKYNEQFIDGIKHTQRHPHENDADGFDFHDCEKLDFVHSFGTVYIFGKYGYVANGYSWWRFEMSDLKKQMN